MTTERGFTVSRRDAPEVLQSTSPSKSEGAGKTGCAPHPRSHVRVAQEQAAHEHTGLAEASGPPCAMALRLIRDRPGDPAFCDTIALRPRWQPLNLTPASGRRTQTISPYVKCRARQSRPYVHRFPAPRLRRWPTPLWWDRMAGVMDLICPTGPAKYFCAEGWTGFA